MWGEGFKHEALTDGDMRGTKRQGQGVVMQSAERGGCCTAVVVSKYSPLCTVAVSQIQNMEKCVIPDWIRAPIFLLWGSSANHCTTMPHMLTYTIKVWDCLQTSLKSSQFINSI